MTTPRNPELTPAPPRGVPGRRASLCDFARLDWLALTSWRRSVRPESEPDLRVEASRQASRHELLRRESRVRILLRREEGMILKVYREPPWLYWRNLWRRSPAEREFRGLAQLQAAGVAVPLPGFWGHGRALGAYTRSFLTMNYLDGTLPLKDFLDRPRPRAQRRAVLARLADQVARMHAASIWHGRLTPKNVLVRDGLAPEVYLIDTAYSLRFPAGLPALARRLDLLHLLGRDSLSRPEKLRFLRRYDGNRRPSCWAAVQRRRGFLRKLAEELTYPLLAGWRSRSARRKERTASIPRTAP